ncbi:MAG: MgtC/SapB family protein [Ferruginibacter sp.]|nr:MgtC/SapB family protein [Ferruginibacter sp.]
MLSYEEILIRLSLASLFGALIGLERERKDWAAGLRTHMMVCVGSCLIMIVSAFGFTDILGTAHVELDPSRVAAQVISGIGFLGAGAILFLKGGTVRGLTTAAGLWTVAGIGLATGGGLYFAAGATTIIALIILWAIQPLEKYYSRKFRHMSLRIVTDAALGNSALLKDLLTKERLKIQTFTLEKQDADYIFLITFENIDQQKMDILIDELNSHNNIKEIFWTQ